MNRKLREDDRSAVDLLLDRFAVASALAGTYVTRGSSASNERVRAASRVLRLLNAVLVNEPPADLIARTMRRIDSAEQAAPTEDLREAPYINRQQPLM